MSNLQLSDEEYIEFKNKCGRFLPVFYFDFLKGYRYDPSEVGVTQNNGKLTVTINGLWFRTILWEVPLMAIISQLYFEMTEQKSLYSNDELSEKKCHKSQIILL